jgi:hypothetical protein
MEPEGRREKGEGRGRRGTVGTAQRPYLLSIYHKGILTEPEGRREEGGVMCAYGGPSDPM